MDREGRVTSAELAPRLDKAIGPHKLLEHPFYDAWAAGTLTRDDLSFYARQYWRQVEAFPGYLADLAARFEGPTRATLEANLSDERDGDHAGLWLRFAQALGADAGEVASSPAEPETRSCVDAFRSGMHGDRMFALGMLYGYESQTPEVARTKVEGLRGHYGIDGPGVEYFELHGDLDVEHAGDLADAIAREAGSEADVAEAEAGVSAGAEAVWGLLDGVARVQGIGC